MFLKNGILFITHALANIVPDSDIEYLYLKPLSKKLTESSIVMKELQLLIDVKSEAKTTLNQLIKILRTYPDLITNDEISFVVSGNRPPLDEYVNYPDYILFDYQSLEGITHTETLKKIALSVFLFTSFRSGQVNPKYFLMILTP